MSKVDIKEQIFSLVGEKGKHYVLSRLIEQRVSISTAEKLVSNRYERIPSGTLRTVLEQVIESMLSEQESKAV